MVLPQATFLISSCGNNLSLPGISCSLLPMTSKADKLPLNTEPAAHDHNTSLTLKTGHQTFLVSLTQLIIIVEHDQTSDAIKRENKHS